MPLSVGDRLGSFEITAKLGAGGMGEVYRATDSKLRRDVAIKILPAVFLEDPDRLARFEREAHVLAQLHHPNIASIFGLEDSSGTRALVMELVDGDDLSALIARGPMPWTEALPIARQIAEALEAAHAAGIVHRDLKPANVKVKADGTVKVLDFGLAKSGEPTAVSGPNAGNSPTLTGRATQLGMVMGTAAYMAPEQARGSAVDKRADVWAFGVVLDEMLTGDRMFEGESAIDTLSAVMRKEIDLARLPASTPPELRSLIRRCIERNPKNRLHDIADARIVIDELQRGAREEPATSAPAVPVRRSWVAVASMVALAVVAGAGAGWMVRGGGSTDARPPLRFALAIPDGYAISDSERPQIAISQDGRLQAAVVIDDAGSPQILLRRSDTVEPRILPDTVGANTPFFSPDGAWVGYFRGTGLYKLPVAGGPPVLLASVTAAELTRGGTWSRDGFIYYSATVNAGLSRVPEGGGDVTPVTTVGIDTNERTHRWPDAFPDGSAVLFTCDSFGSTEYYDDARIEAVRPETGERRVVLEGASQARYGGGDTLVFARGGALFVVGFDAKSLKVRGTPQSVVQQVSTDVSSGAVRFALSGNGAAIWVTGAESARQVISWVDRDGQESAVPLAQVPYNEAELSPDGGQVALVGGSGGAGDLWVADLARGTLSRLTTDSSVLNPIWSPDGKTLVWIERVQTPTTDRLFRLMAKLADGSRDARVVLESGEFLSLGAFTPDGSTIVFSSGIPGGSRADLYALPLSGDRKPEVLLADAFVKREPAVSPDGRYLAYISNEGAQPAVFVRPFPSGEGRWQLSPPGSFEPRWSSDGRALYFRCRGALHEVAIDTRNGFVPGRATVILDRVLNSGAVKTYAVALGGRRIFAFRRPADRGAMRSLNLDLDFGERLSKK